jgi:hypothetical protein
MGLEFENKADFIIKTVNDKFIYLEDTGHNQFKTVTNDVENVLGIIKDTNDISKLRLFYKDSNEEIDEIIHNQGVFIRFKHGHKGFELGEIMGYEPLHKHEKRTKSRDDDFGR